LQPVPLNSAFRPVPAPLKKPVFLPFLAKNPSSKIILEVAEIISAIADFVLEDAETVLEVAETISANAFSISAIAEIGLETADFILEDAFLVLEVAETTLAIADLCPDKAGTVRMCGVATLQKLPLNTTKHVK
jgi:hypothetical protein